MTEDQELRVKCLELANDSNLHTNEILKSAKEYYAFAMSADVPAGDA